MVSPLWICVAGAPLLLGADGLPEHPVVAWTFRPPARRIDLGANAWKDEIPCVGDVLQVDGILYFGDDGGIVRALRARDGKVLWEYGCGSRVCSAPASAGDLIIFSSGRGISAVSRKRGDHAWAQEIPDGALESAPLVAGTLVSVAGYDGIVYAFDARTGKRRWEQDIVKDAPPDPPGFSGRSARVGEVRARPRSASTDGETIFQPIFDQSRVVALDLQTGKLRWSFQAKGWIYGTPAVGDRHIVIGSQDDILYCLDKKTGEVVWQYKTGARIEADPAIHDGAALAGSCDGTFHCVDLETGKPRWTFATDVDYAGHRALYERPLIAFGKIYLAAMEGQLYALNAKSGELLWKFRPSKASQLITDPVTDGRRIFVATRLNWNDGGEIGLFAIGEKGE